MESRHSRQIRHNISAHNSSILTTHIIFIPQLSVESVESVEVLSSKLKIVSEAVTQTEGTGGLYDFFAVSDSLPALLASTG